MSGATPMSRNTNNTPMSVGQQASIGGTSLGPSVSQRPSISFEVIPPSPGADDSEPDDEDIIIPGMGTMHPYMPVWQSTVFA